MRRIDLIGCGGIGGHVARNLCRFLHSERRAAHVVVVDGDAYEERNRSRMSFTAPENKALLLGRELAAEFGDVLTIEPVPEYVAAANLASLIRNGDLVFLAVDNHATRRLVDGWCAGLGDVTLIRFSGQPVAWRASRRARKEKRDAPEASEAVSAGVSA